MLLLTTNQFHIMLGPAELNRTLQYLDLNYRKVDDIEEHRCFWCIFYDLCLKIAAHKNWQSFTCKYCPNFSNDLDSFDAPIVIH